MVEFDRGSVERAAYKEEAVEMHLEGFNNKPRPSNIYNERQSPGLNYIETDGF